MRARPIPSPMGPDQNKTIHISISPPLTEHLVLLTDCMCRLADKSMGAAQEIRSEEADLLNQELPLKWVSLMTLYSMILCQIIFSEKGAIP
jgi:hypothetical protein